MAKKKAAKNVKLLALIAAIVGVGLFSFFVLKTSSRYDSLSNTCECSYGYVIDGTGKCVSGSQACWNKYGYSSTHNSLNNTCECSYGYVFNSTGTKCISEDESCKESYGYGAKSVLGNKCECRSGYEWEGNKCVLSTYEFETDPINIEPITPIQTIKPASKPKSTPKESEAPSYIFTPTPLPNTSPEISLGEILWDMIKYYINTFPPFKIRK